MNKLRDPKDSKSLQRKNKLRKEAAAKALLDIKEQDLLRAGDEGFPMTHFDQKGQP